MTAEKIKSCGCSGSGSRSNLDHTLPGKGWVKDFLSTPVGNVPIIDTRLTASDKRGTWLARWSNKRMSYKIQPGLYGIGKPDENSPVLVTANYKLTLDALRKELEGVNAWILVLDTKGINVWCAAGKGTFGTEELIQRIKSVRLDSLVAHRKLILPQLGAPGTAAHKVTKETGFKVIYGPVRAADIPAFLKNGLKKSPAMREVKFPFKERLALAPMELVQVIKKIHYFIIPISLLNLIKGGPFVMNTIYELLFFMGAIFLGAVLTPVLLPWIPVRSFALKGWITGAIFAAVIGLFFAAGPLEQLIYLLLLPPVSAFLALNFTGASTYTSLSGVVKEMKTALPLIILSMAVGLILRIYTVF